MKKIFYIVATILFYFFSINYSFAENKFHVKCGTYNLLNNTALLAAKVAQGRPQSQLSTLSSLKHFRVHWDSTGYNAPAKTDANKNKIPDYVDSTLIYLEYSWNTIVNQLGYNEPLSDKGLGGGNEVDVYLLNLSSEKNYGYTIYDNYAQSTSAYIAIENDFSETNIFSTLGYEALKVTTAHEFFHVVQFRYYSYITFNWWMEQTAVWMEDRSWNDVNDYFAYLDSFFNAPTTPLNDNNYSFKYGAGIWAMFLAKRFGDDVIKKIWEQAYTTKNESISIFGNVIPNGLGNALNEFAVWNYFTKDRANDSDFYNDGSLYKYKVNTDYTSYKSSADSTFSINHLTSRYVEMYFTGVWNANDSLKITVFPIDDGSFKSSVIFYNTPSVYKIIKLTTKSETISMGGIWNKAILATSCVNTSGTYRYSFNLDTIRSDVGVEKEHPVVFKVNGVFPNPFNPQTTIAFTLPSSGNVIVKVYNSLGQTVATLFDGYMNAGEKMIFWKPENLSGGLYFVNIVTPYGNKTVKTTFLK